ncbi:hypothetical protein [Paracoccus sp. (in: a-proteobacteria)]|uniref:hypothetical protein n=1 Tax=Paracoccus sp. TaxID=267 RepID=UPI002AFF3774|nr:hypothetical protein [Paracoccus sp. (in: a-proteobacteria)]
MGWDEHREMMESVVAAYFDTTPFTLTGMTKPARQVNAVEVVDLERPAFEFRGTLHLDPEFSTLDRRAQPSAADRNIRQVSRICLTALHKAWPWQPRQGDRVQGPDGLYVLASNPDRDGTGRIVIWLNKVSG